MGPHAFYVAEIEGSHAAHPGVNGAATAQDFPYSGIVTLKAALAFACLSRATAYKHGIVPEYDDDGQLAATGKVPPFPWTCMPHSLIRNRKGKKLFLAKEIRAWLEAIRDRSREIDTANNSNPSALNKRGENQNG